METTYAAAVGGHARRDTRVRVMSVIAGMALVLAAFVMIQQPAEASPGRAPVAAAVAIGAAVGDIAPQFTNFICSLLLSIFSSFQNSPFFAFLATFFNNFLAAFGCNISTG